ncbi:hypothetical protein AeNC1_017115, partial [Aphanomyces euteiches]
MEDTRERTQSMSNSSAAHQDGPANNTNVEQPRSPVADSSHDQERLLGIRQQTSNTYHMDTPYNLAPGLTYDIQHGPRTQRQRLGMTSSSSGSAGSYDIMARNTYLPTRNVFPSSKERANQPPAMYGMNYRPPSSNYWASQPSFTQPFAAAAPAAISRAELDMREKIKELEALVRQQAEALQQQKLDILQRVSDLQNQTMAAENCDVPQQTVPDQGQTQQQTQGPRGHHVGSTASSEFVDVSKRSHASIPTATYPWIQRMGEVPKPPIWNGGGFSARREFYIQYQSSLQKCHLQSTPTNQIVPVSIGLCMSLRQQEFITGFECLNTPEEMTEEKFHEFFAKAGRFQRCEGVDDVVALLKSRVKMETGNRNAMDVISKWKWAIYTCLEDINYLDFGGDNPKEYIKALLETIRPEDVRLRVKNELSNEYKHLKHDVPGFFAFVENRVEMRVGFYSMAKPQKADTEAKQASSGAKTNKEAQRNAEYGGSDQRALRTPDSRGDGKGPKVDKLGQPLVCWNPKCKGQHLTQRCPKTTYAEFLKLRTEQRLSYNKALTNNNTALANENLSKVDNKATPAMTPPASPKRVQWPKKVAQKLNSLRNKDAADRGTCPAILEGKVRVEAVLWDSGADQAIVSTGLLKLLGDANITIVSHQLDEPMELVDFQKNVLQADRVVTFSTIEFILSAGKVTVRNASFFVHDIPVAELTMSRAMMNRLGYSTDAFLVKAGSMEDFYDMYDLLNQGQNQRSLMMLEDDDCDDNPYEDGDVTVDAMAHDVEDAAVLSKLDAAVAKCVQAGLSNDSADRLRVLLHDFRDIFRLQMRVNDGPVAVKPLVVTLKPTAKPFKCKMRRYAPTHQEYLSQHIRELVNAGRLRKVSTSRYAKCREQNAKTEPLAFPMPDLEGIFSRMRGSTIFFKLDAFKYFWQLALAEESQELFTFMVPDGLYQSTRVPMGICDAVAYAQSTMHEVHGDLMPGNVTAWVDDIVGYAASVDELLSVLSQCFSRYREYGLKLHPDKCEFFLPEVTWCGRVISSAGISHDPQRIQGLLDLPPPTTAGDLQQFLGAVGWMRGNIPRFAELTEPLRSLLEEACTLAGSRKKRQLQAVSLSVAGWGAMHAAAYEDVKSALIAMAPLHHYDPNRRVC